MADNKERLASETIYSGTYNIIPMCDVAYINKDLRKGWEECITIVFKCSRWVDAFVNFEPNLYMQADEAKRFLRAWSDYRSEIDPVRQGP